MGFSSEQGGRDVEGGYLCLNDGLALSLMIPIPLSILCFVPFRMVLWPGAMILMEAGEERFLEILPRSVMSF